MALGFVPRQGTRRDSKGHLQSGLGAKRISWSEIDAFAIHDLERLGRGHSFGVHLHERDPGDRATPIARLLELFALVKGATAMGARISKAEISANFIDLPPAAVCHNHEEPFTQ
jgi:hypothetical protein